MATPVGSARGNPAPTSAHQRSTSAVVATRDDSVPSEPGPLPPRRDDAGRRWPTVLVWLLLGSAIAALWALLLAGDSLPVSG